MNPCMLCATSFLPTLIIWKSIEKPRKENKYLAILEVFNVLFVLSNRFVCLFIVCNPSLEIFQGGNRVHIFIVGAAQLESHVTFQYLRNQHNTYLEPRTFLSVHILSRKRMLRSSISCTRLRIIFLLATVELVASI